MAKRSWIQPTIIFSVSASAVILVACGLDRGEKSSTVTVSIPALRTEAEQNRIQESFRVQNSVGISSVNLVLPPAQISGFDCVAVNIMGSDIPASDNDGGDEDPATILANFKKKNYCSYAGLTSTPQKVTSSPITLEIPNVPKGENRVVELIGIRVAPGQDCPKTVGGEKGGDDSLKPRYFHIGSVTTAIAGDTVVQIPNEYKNTLPRLLSSVECGEAPISATYDCGGATPQAIPATFSSQTLVYRLQVPSAIAPAPIPTTLVRIAITGVQAQYYPNPAASPTSAALDTNNSSCVNNLGGAVLAEGSHCELKFPASGEANAPVRFTVTYSVIETGTSNNPKSYTDTRSYPITCN
ncbi:MAG: hypothetical protein EOP09_05430 [Proteobacteria bacterium]|nr:MAG: hypothetical protein EOP09_05430 [Pseudomonadota bacterium]